MNASKLVDNFGRTHRYLRISVTDRCNFRCVYCMPEEDVPFRERDEILHFEEIERLTRVFASLGVNKVRLTGGEPTVRKDVESLMRMLAAVPGVDRLLMTTNGLTLRERATAYRQAGVSGLNVSLDSLRQDRFRQITRTDHFQRVFDGIQAALQAGFESLKINVVVMAGVNEDEVLDFAELTRDWPVTVRFIEFMPFLGNGWSKGKLYPYARIRADIESWRPLEPCRVDASAVGKDFQIPGFAGKIGFVTSMTESFCADCDRIRLTAEGNVKPCLFSSVEVPLRDALRSGADDGELAALIHEALARKPAEHPPHELIPSFENRPMVMIGG
jgi:molybdenum cofactor biosynthesis protein A